MPQIIVGSLASLLGIVLTVQITAWARGWRPLKPTLGSWLGLVGFLGIHIILELYRFGSTVAMQVAMWQGALIMCGVIFASLLRLISGRAHYEQPLVWALAICSVFLVMTPMNEPAGQRLGEFTLAVIIFGLCVECMILIPKQDAMARSVWAVTTVANGLTAFQIFDCQLIRGVLYTPRETDSACSKIYGPYMEWFLVAGCILAVILVLFRHDRLERG